MKQEITDELLSLNEAKRQTLIDLHKANGVKIIGESSVYIGAQAEIESGAIILPGSMLLGKTKVSSGCTVGPNTLLYDCTVKKNSSLNCVQAHSSTVDENCDIGPFVHIRPGSTIGREVHLGNFVEVKNSVIGDKTKVSHLTYIGDSDIGSGCNFGCGCVTVNYNGKEKHRTKVGNGCFIGCNTNLIAPVELGDFAYTAAGSTITGDVPKNALAIARSRQENKENWVTKRKPYKEK